MRTKKYVFSMFLLATSLVLASGSLFSQAFAVASLNAGNTTLAAEKIPPTTGYYTIDAVNTAYEPAGAVAVSTVLEVSLANGAFTPGSTIQLCSGTDPVSIIATVAAAPNNTSVTLTLIDSLASGLVYTFDDACVGPGDPLTNVTVPAGTLAGAVVTMTVANAANAADPNILASATVLTVMNQFSATLLPVTSALSFATNEFTFLPSGTALPYTPDANDSDASLVITSNDSINDNVVLTGGPACLWTLPNAADSFKFKVVGDLHGIGTIVYDGAAPYTVLAADVANGYATLQVANTAINICKTTDASVTAYKMDLTAQNTTAAMVVGTRTLEATVLGGSGGAGDLAVGYSRDVLSPAVETGWVFQLAANSFFVPYIATNTATGAETYIKFQSKTTQTGANGVSANVLIPSTPYYVTVSLPAMTSGAVYTVTGSQLIAAATAAGQAVSGATSTGSSGFAAVITISTPASDIFAYANVCDAAGCRNLPVEVGTNGNNLPGLHLE
jgi:hypothetical protein